MRTKFSWLARILTSLGLIAWTVLSPFYIVPSELMLPWLMIWIIISGYLVVVLFTPAPPTDKDPAPVHGPTKVGAIYCSGILLVCLIAFIFMIVTLSDMNWSFIPLIALPILVMVMLYCSWRVFDYLLVERTDEVGAYVTPYQTSETVEQKRARDDLIAAGMIRQRWRRGR